MIRFIITALFLLVFGIVSIPMLLIEWAIGKISPKAQLVSSFRFVQGTCWVVLFLCGALPKVKGKENIPADAPVLYVANHRSIFDIPVTLVLSPGPLCFIAKKEHFPKGPAAPLKTNRSCWNSTKEASGSQSGPDVR